MTSYKTTTYFFPNNKKRINTQSRYSPLLTIQRKQIKNQLSELLSYNKHEEKYINNQAYYKTHSSISNHGPKIFYKRKQKMENKKDNEKKLNDQNPSLIYNLLERVRLLRKEEQCMKNNPFYKIQKTRNTNKQVQKQLSLPTQMLNYEQERDDTRLFHNLGLSGVECSNEKYNKIRGKSQNVTYYQIKNYFQQKYCKSPQTL